MKSYLFLIVLSSVLLTSCDTQRKALQKDTSTTDIPNGLSYQTAIIVSSVDQEYEWVRHQCKQCSFKGQALTFKNERPFDILTFVDQNGNEVNYYFDISSFYGKW